MNISSILANYAQTDRIDALVILEFVVQKDRAWVLAHDDYELSKEQQQKFDQLAKRRANGEPLAYIIGTKEFYGHNFYVTKEVLVPRPESEAFIDLLTSFKPLLGQSLIDVGTGSGALAISAKLAYPKLQVTGVDISNPALKVALKNSTLHKTKINFVQSDLFNNIKTSFDYIFANLPYVPTTLQVSKEVLNEPNIAMFSGKDGLDCVRSFIEPAFLHCKAGGYVLIESLLIQHNTVQELAGKYNLKLVKTIGLVQVYQQNSNI